MPYGTKISATRLCRCYRLRTLAPEESIKAQCVSLSPAYIFPSISPLRVNSLSLHIQSWPVLLLADPNAHTHAHPVHHILLRSRDLRSTHRRKLPKEEGHAGGWGTKRGYGREEESVDREFEGVARSSHRRKAQQVKGIMVSWSLPVFLSNVWLTKCVYNSGMFKSDGTNIFCPGCSYT